jgi:two-component system, NarL family, nitrate/nitrite response regulator NarL
MPVIAGPGSSDRPQWIEDRNEQSQFSSHAAIAADIRLIITSSVRLVREGLAATLRGRDGVVVVGAVDPSPQGIASIADAKPDVVLIDVGETDTHSAAAARLIRAASPTARLVAFGLDEIDDRVFACAAARFSGYVPRDSGADELHRALVDAMEGRMHCAPHIVAAMFNRLADFLQESESPEPLPSLTFRESEILALVKQGRSNKDIARQLAISSATVKNHMHNILQKLQVSPRGQAAARFEVHSGT